MTNTVNLQKMVQVDTSSVKKQDNAAAQNDAGEDFKLLVSQKTESKQEDDETKTQDKKTENNKPEKELKEELKPGEAIPLTDLLFSRPEVLTDTEKSVALTQLPIENKITGSTDNQFLDNYFLDNQPLDNQPIQLYDQRMAETLTEMPIGNNQAQVNSAAVIDQIFINEQPAIEMQQPVIEMQKPVIEMQQPVNAMQEVKTPMAQAAVTENQADTIGNIQKQPSQMKDSPVGEKAQYVNKTQNFETTVDNHVVSEVEEHPTKADDVKVSVENLKEEASNEIKGEVKDISQLSVEEKKDDQNKAVVWNDNYTQPEVHQKEVVRIKVAEPYNKIDTETVKTLANKITEHISQGKKEFTVQLNPEMLGKIAVKISMADDGIKVTLSCEKQKTCQLLAEQASGINRIVESNTGQTSIVEVKEGYWDQQKDATDQHSRQNQNQEQSQQEKASKAETDDFIQQLRLGFFDNRISV